MKEEQTQLEEQIRDLQQLEEGNEVGQSDADEDMLSDMGEDDSDAEEMRRIKQIQEQ